jgi:cytidylate kinase
VITITGVKYNPDPRFSERGARGFSYLHPGSPYSHRHGRRLGRRVLHSAAAARPGREGWNHRVLIVTVSREYGAAAQAVARALAAILTYRLVDEELPRLIAARLGMPAEVVESVENRAPGFGERLLAGLSGAVPELAQAAILPAEDLTAAYRREVERIVREAAAGGDAIILGRLANAILGPRPDLVRVFVYAPLPWRIAYVSASFGCDANAARSEIARIDEARRTYARERYNMAWADLRNYDLAVDTARFGVDGAAHVIACAVRSAQLA